MWAQKHEHMQSHTHI